MAADLDDIVQLAMMRVLQAAPHLREGTGPSTASYLWRTAFSVTIDEIRRRQRRPEQPLGDSAHAEPESPAPDPLRYAEAQQMGAAIRDCVHRLTTTRRPAVVLFLQGHTIRETAERMACSVKKAENLIYRGLTDLRGCLAGKGFTP